MHTGYTELCEALASDARSAVLHSIAVEIAKNPDNATAYAVNAHALAMEGRLADSARAYETALDMDAEQPEALSDFIQVVLALGELDRAKKIASKAILDFPDSANCHFVAANVFQRLGDVQSVEYSLRKTLALKPDSGTAAFKLAGLLIQAQDYPQALHYCQLAAAQLSDDASVSNRLGHILHGMHDPKAAIVQFEKAVKQRPDWNIPWHNLGRACVDAGYPERAVSMYQKAIACDPDYSASHGCLATELLKLGHWAEGWSAFEWRFGEGGQIPKRNGYPAPVWDGRQLHGECVMVWIEQGLGDNLQFFRFTRAIQEKGGKVWIQAPTQCACLYESCVWIDRVITTSDVEQAFDYQIPLMSLPHVLGIQSESELAMAGPYLHAPACRPAAEFECRGDANKYRVGIVWASSQTNQAHLTRDCPVDVILPLNQISGVELFSFQFGDCAADLDGKGSQGVVDLSEMIGDFVSTAAFIAEMDLIITVDTAMAHLAGALGANTWLLLGEPCDWRWLYDRQDSPWYPSMRLFRQPVPGDWSAVMSDVEAALASQLKKPGQ